jgi:hypothetical protein
MTDLTNKIQSTSEIDIEELYKKYNPLFEFIKDKKQIPYLVVIIDWSIKYIKENYNDLELDWKAWSVVFLKHKYLRGKLKKESDIYETIDDFIKHYKEKYESYVKNLAMYVSDFDRDYGFVCNYLK